MKRLIVYSTYCFIIFINACLSYADIITPAYMSNSNYTATDNDLKETNGTQLTDKIRETVAKLNYDPVKMYEFVKNQIDYIPYYGCKLGATGVLFEGQGNAYDQASLLIAMYRSIGIPCRYIEGKVKVKKNNVMNWLGVDNAEAAKSILITNGIFIESDSVYFTIYHVWIEAKMPYAGTRGKPLANNGMDFELSNDGDFIVKTNEESQGLWIPLDPSYKKYINKFPKRLPNGMPVDALDFLNQYIYSPVEKMPDELYRENLKKYLSERYPQYSIEDLEFERKIVNEKINIIPSELSPEIIIEEIDNETSGVPDDKLWKVNIKVTRSGNKILDEIDGEGLVRCLSDIYNKKISLTFDVNTTGTYFQKINIYTTSLLPYLSIGDEVINKGQTTTCTVGTQELDVKLEYTIPQPNQKHFTIVGENSIKAGTYLTIAINYGNMSHDIVEQAYRDFKKLQDAVRRDEIEAWDVAPICQLLYTLGIQYFYNVNESNKTLSSLMNCNNYTWVSHAFVKNAVAVDGSYWVGGPINLDINLNHIASWSRNNDLIETQDYTLLSGMSGSAHEHKIFEDMLELEATSSMKMLRLANEYEDNEVVYIDKYIYDKCGGTAQDLIDELGLEYTTTFITNHIKFTDELTNALYIIPKRMFTEQELEAGAGTGYIVITNQYGSANYSGPVKYLLTNANGEITNGGWLTSFIDKVFGAICDFLFDFLNDTVGKIIAALDIFQFEFEFEFLGFCVTIDESTIFSVAASMFTSAVLIPGAQAACNGFLNAAAKGSMNGSFFKNLAQTAGNVFNSAKQEVVKQIKTAGQFVKKVWTTIATAADPVDMRTGEFYTTDIDINIPGDLPIIVKRNYFSGQETFDFIGYGWILNLNYFLWANTFGIDYVDYDSNNDNTLDLVVFRMPENDGSVIEYRLAEQDANSAVFKPLASFNPELINIYDNGIGSAFGYLGNTIEIDKSTRQVTYRSHTGMTKVFKYRLFSSNGEKIKERLYLIKTEDIYGNYLEYEYNEDDKSYGGYGLPKTIRNKSGSWIDFEYDGSGKVTKITSSDRREIQYYYDDIWNLTKVVDASGKVTKYEYALDNEGYTTHNISRVIKPDNRILENVYDDEKVIEQSMSIGFDTTPVQVNRMVYGDIDDEGNFTTTLYTTISENDNGSLKEIKTIYKHEDLWAKNGKCIIDFADYPAEKNISINDNDACITSSTAELDEEFIKLNDPGHYLRISYPQIALGNTIKTLEFSFKYTGTLPQTDITLYQEGSDLIYMDLDNTSKLNVSINACTLESQTDEWEEDTWYHVSIVLDDAEDKLLLYVNNLLEAEDDSTLSTIINSSDIDFKGGTSTCPVYFDDIGFYAINKTPGSERLPRLLSVTETGFADDNINFALSRTWDMHGNLDTMTDQNGVITDYTYDSLDRLTKVRVLAGETDNDTLDIITEYSYRDNDADANLKYKVNQIIDPLGNKTKFYYYESTNDMHIGALRKMQKCFDNDTVCYTEDYDYNSAGHLIKKTISKNSQSVEINYSYDRFGNIIEIENPEGEVSSFAYDEWGNRTRVTNPLHETTLFEYDKANRVIKVVDPEGGKKYFEYDDNSNKTAEIDANGNEALYLYDYSNSLLGAMDPLGFTVVTDYDIFGNQLAVQNQNGYTKYIEYDGVNRVSKEIDTVIENETEVTYTTEYEYDSRGNVLKKELIRNENQPVSRELSEYNFLNKLVSKKTYFDNDSYLLVETDYDKAGNKIKETYYLNNETNFDKYTTYTYSIEFDGKYRLKQLQMFDNQENNIYTESYEYDFLGNKISQTNALCYKTLFEYDNAGRLIAQKVPLKENPSSDDDYAITTYTYDKAGRVIKETDPNGNTVQHEYDKNGKIIAQYDPLGRKTFFEYDKNGNKTKSIAPSGKIVIYEYDALNRMTAIIDEDNNKSKIVYDGVGNKIQTIDAENNITDYYYDSIKRLIRQTDQLEYNIDYIYGYDTTSHIATKEMLAERDNENSRRAKWWTDWQGNPVKQIDGQGEDEKTTLFTYDYYSRLTSKTTPKGDIISFGYDELGHEESITCDNDSSVDATFTYNKIGQKTVMSDITGTTRYYYDPAGRLTRKLDSKNYPVYYEYDKAGNKTKMTFTGINRPDDLTPDTVNYPYVTQTVTYAYNAANQLTEITSSYNSDSGEISKTTTFDYDTRSGMLLKKIYPDNSYVTYEYDKHDRLAELANYFDNDSLISSEDYFYNKLHNKTKIITNRQGQEFVAVYNYDAKNQLIKEFYKDDDNEGTPHRIEYVYDGTGNRKYIKDTSNSVTTTYEYTVNNLNQLIAVNNWQNTAGELDELYIWGVYQGERGNNIIKIDSNPASYDDGKKLFYENDNDIPSTSFQIKENDSTVVTVELDNENDICYTYDDNGNLIYKSQNGISTSYQFDALNRLVKVYYTTPDASGDPVIQKLRHFYNADGQRICTIDNDGSLTHYIYDGPISIAECDNTGKVNKQFIHGGGLAGDVGSLVYKEQLDSSQADGVDTSYFFYNYRGDVIDVLSDNGTISYRYDAFGNVIHLSGDEIENSFLFSSKRFNEAIGLSYFEARYYDAFIGRFISRDPMGFIDGPNQYFYCMNNPLGYIDPFGLNKRGLLWAWDGLADLAVSPARATYNHFFEEYDIERIKEIPLPLSKSDPINIYASGNWTNLFKPNPNGDTAYEDAKNLNSHYVLNDPSSGFFTDFFGSILDSTLGRVIPSRKSFQYADFIQNDLRVKGRVLNIAAFSQSAITVTAGNEILRNEGFTYKDGSKMIYMGSGAPTERIKEAGGRVNMIYGKNLFISNHPEDPIPAIAHLDFIGTGKFWHNIWGKPPIHSVDHYSGYTRKELPEEVWY